MIYISSSRIISLLPSGPKSTSLKFRVSTKPGEDAGRGLYSISQHPGHLFAKKPDPWDFGKPTFAIVAIYRHVHAVLVRFCGRECVACASFLRMIPMICTLERK
ncbi:hypothetical protein J3458_001527 [Metarhizium acridum]|uniref:uncharacterized protein n=1 Tax=Metarhizium acridum TaxID=92637 RepID=UPI001C6C5AE2|nr:hypothetical protein J3458_001527 [Metarhizium acridum]